MSRKKDWMDPEENGLKRDRDPVKSQSQAKEEKESPARGDLPREENSVDPTFTPKKNTTKLSGTLPPAGNSPRQRNADLSSEAKSPRSSDREYRDHRDYRDYEDETAAILREAMRGDTLAKEALIMDARENASAKIAEQIAEQITEQIAEQLAEHISEQIAEHIECIAETTEERLTDECVSLEREEDEDDGENASHVDIYAEPEELYAEVEDEVLDAEEEITEETVEEATREAIEEVTADIEEEEEILAEQRPQEMERKFEYLEALLDERRYADFRQELEELNPVDAADFFSELKPKRIPAVFQLLDTDTAAPVVTELDVEVQGRIITAMTDREISFIVEEMALDDTTEMLKELPANMVHRIMKNATPETRTDINRLLAYPERSAGSVMTAEFIDLRRDMTCAEAIARIRKTGVDKETVYVAYVVDAQRVLQGAVPLKDLLFASADDLIEDIMDEDIICASTMDDQETVASTVAKYGMLAIPIVDREYRLVGIVTVDDAMEVMETETTEDIEKMAAISPTDKPYLRTGVFETWKKRVPWLLLLMLSATFTSTILAHFESVLDAATLSLAVFVPMLMGTGGNASSQTSVTVIRGLSLGEIEPRDILRVLWKELCVSAICGLTVAVACFAKTMLVDLKLVFTPETIEVAAIVSITMFCAVVFAKLMGVLFPIGAKRVGLDPAVMASPFITTVVDTLTLLIYVWIAMAVLNI